MPPAGERLTSPRHIERNPGSIAPPRCLWPLPGIRPHPAPLDDGQCCRIWNLRDSPSSELAQLGLGRRRGFDVLDRGVPSRCDKEPDADREGQLAHERGRPQGFVTRTLPGLLRGDTSGIPDQCGGLRCFWLVRKKAETHSNAVVVTGSGWFTHDFPHPFRHYSRRAGPLGAFGVVVGRPGTVCIMADGWL